MPEIPIEIKIADMWGEDSFTRNDWGNVNFLVGPNGTGKSRFSDKLKKQLKTAGYKVRLLNAERLTGFEKTNYSSDISINQLQSGLSINKFSKYKSQSDNHGLSTSAFVLLKERLDVRINVEAFLTDMFSKSIRLVEEGGFLKPKVQNIAGGEEYVIKTAECHGLKELITLLAYLFDPNKDCIILDEPELHLHPQYQSFLFSKIREISGDPKADPRKKLFFIITHSPYFLDFKVIDDLKNVIVFQPNNVPEYISDFVGDDEYILKKFLPRFNTHHKQLFFSSTPVFVEGYTDQQIVSLLYERTDRNIGAAGSCVIDVGGKDELAVFFRLCHSFGMSPRIVADLDALFEGKLRQVVCEAAEPSAFLQKSGVGEDMQREIGDLQKQLNSVADILRQQQIENEGIARLVDSLKELVDEHGNVVEGRLPEYRLKMLLGATRFSEEIAAALSEGNRGLVDLISGRFEKLLEAAKQAGVFFLPLGELEHYYTQTKFDYLSINDQQKSSAFHVERDYLLGCSREDVDATYGDLNAWLDEAVPHVDVDFGTHVRYQMIEWIQQVQLAVVRGEVTSLEQLKSNGRINYALYSQVFEATNFNFAENKQFSCTVKVSDSLVRDTAPVTFTQATSAAEVQIANNA